MFEAVKTPCLVPFNGDFQLSKASTLVKEVKEDKKYKKRLEKLVDELDDLQRRLYASDKFSVLLVFQAMDAAGKDSTIHTTRCIVRPNFVPSTKWAGKAEYCFTLNSPISSAYCPTS